METNNLTKDIKKTSELKNNLLNGIIKENPLFISLLGLCPSLATTSKIESAIGMGFLFLFVIMLTNVVISFLAKFIPDEIRIPSYIVIIAGISTIAKILAQAFLPTLYSTLGVYLSLIVVNCIILGRATSFASSNKPLNSLMDAIGSGVGFSMALVIIAFIRELLGTGCLTIGEVFTFIPYFKLKLFESYAISLFINPPGGFLVLGLILAVIASYKNVKEKKQ